MAFKVIKDIRCSYEYSEETDEHSFGGDRSVVSQIGARPQQGPFRSVRDKIGRQEQKLGHSKDGNGRSKGVTEGITRDTY